MASKRSEDLTVSPSTATALPVASTGPGGLPALYAPDARAAHVEDLQLRMAAPSVKLRLAGLRMLFDWLVVGQIIPANPASAVRGPKHSVRKGKTPVLTAAEPASCSIRS